MIIKEGKKKYCFSVDWLSFSVKLQNEDADLKCPKGYRLELYDGNNIFKRRAILMDELGRKVLTMLWKPHSSIIAPNICTVQVGNELLYTEEEDCAMKLLNQMTPCTFNSFSRIDLCIDFEVNSRLMRIIRKLDNGSNYVQGKQNGAKWWHEGEFKGIKTQIPHCLNWGSSSSEIKVKLYNKSREQNLLLPNGVPDKPYIVEQWKWADFDTKNVWRLEFSLSSSGSLLWENKYIDWNMYFSSVWRYSVFCSLYNSRFKIRKNQGKKIGHKNNDEIVPFLNLPKVSERLKWMETNLNIESKESISSVRRIMKELEQPYSLCNELVFTSLADTLTTMVSVGKLEYYFSRVTGCTVQEYISNIYDSVGVGVVKPELKPSTSWE